MEIILLTNWQAKFELSPEAVELYVGYHNAMHNTRWLCRQHRGKMRIYRKSRRGVEYEVMVNFSALRSDPVLILTAKNAKQFLRYKQDSFKIIQTDMPCTIQVVQGMERLIKI